MAGTYNENDHPRNPDGTYRDKDKETSNGELPTDTGSDEQESEEKQRELAREEYDELSNLMDEEYSRLYDLRDQDPKYHEAVTAFDDYAHNHPYEIGEIVDQRGDFISSDREAAAFMFAKWRMNNPEAAHKPTTITSDPFMPLDVRADKCMEFQQAVASGQVGKARELDTDGAMNFMSKAGYAFGKNRDFSQLGTYDGQECVEWAVNDFKSRHPDYLVDVDAVNNRMLAEVNGKRDVANALDEEYPDAYYIMCAAQGKLHPTARTPMYSSDYERMLLDHELSKPTSMYLAATRRLSPKGGRSDLKAGDECWRTKDGYVSDARFKQAFGNDQASMDRYLIYATGTDQDRRDLETEKWNDQVWLASRASECEETGGNSILYRTILPDFSRGD